MTYFLDQNSLILISYLDQIYSKYLMSPPQPKKISYLDLD